MAEHRVDRVLERVTELPFSPVASKVLAVAQDERFGAREIAKIVGQDQAFTARLLRIANSPYYGQSREVTTLSQAVHILGVNTITSLALALSAFGAIPHEENGTLEIGEIWEHSLGCALWAKQMARRVAPAGSEEVFIAGLLHDMGKTLFYRLFRKEFLEAVRLAAAEEISLAESERRLLGVDHAAAGEIVARKWNLPLVLHYAIGFHHRPLALPEEAPPSVRKTVALVHVADLLCEASGIGKGGEGPSTTIEEGVWPLLGLEEQGARELLDPVLSELEKTRELFGLALGWKKTVKKEDAGKRAVEKKISAPEPAGETQTSAAIAPGQEEAMASFSRFIEAGKQIGLLAGLEELLPNIASQSRSLLRADAAEILAPRGESLEVVGAAGIEDLMGTKIPAPKSLAGWVARVGEAMVVSESGEAQPSWEKEFFGPRGYRSHLLLPVEWAGQRIAVISVHSQRARRWKSQEVAFFGVFVELVAVALENARLYKESGEKAAALEELNRELEAALNLKSRFLATVSHELRTPLVAVVGYCNLMAEGAYGEPGDEMRQVLGRVNRAANDLLNMIVNILDLSQMESGAFAVHPERVDLKEVLDEVYARTAALLSGKPVVFEQDCDHPLPPVVADRERLKQILGQLLDNAVKFTHEGKIILSAAAANGGVEVSVRDTGIGIDPGHQRMIFDGFRQVDDTDTRRYGGLGIGLHIVRHLIELLGGKITVESHPARGSTFLIWLPSAESQPALACHQ